MLQACTFSSPNTGPLRKDAPAWCRAPFEPEGLLRYEFLEAVLFTHWMSFGINLYVVEFWFQLDFGYHVWHHWDSLWTCSDPLQGREKRSFLFSFLLKCYDFTIYGLLMMENVGCWLQGHAERLKHWVSMAVVLLAVAVILHFTDGKC